MSFSDNQDIIYYDATILNQNTSNSNNNLQLRFRDRRDTHILKNSEQYELSIVRFNLSTTSLPVFCCTVKPNQLDVNLSIYSVTLQYEDGLNPPVYTQPFNMIWEPVDLDQPVPTSVNEIQTQNKYYYSYSYTHLIKLINNTLISAMDELRLLTGLSNTIDAPFMYWNSENEIATLYGRLSHFNQLVYPQIKIFFNRPLYQLFNTLPTIKMSHDIENRNYLVILEDNLVNNVVLKDGQKFIYSKQEKSTITCMTPIQSVVFTTSLLPVVETILSEPQIYINNQPNLLFPSTLENREKVITDMISDEFSFKPTLLYVPQSEYRMVSLFHMEYIREIDLFVYWRDHYGIAHEFFLSPSDFASIKIMFRKK
jgi:hypothetical protein